MSALDTPAARDGSEFQAYADFSIEYREASHRYWIRTRENERWESGILVIEEPRTPAISVTSALKVLDKPALVAWAERMGVEGALTLEREGELENVPISEAINVVRLHKLGADAKRDAGADRGTAIHEALRLYCSEGRVPNVGDFPAEVRGYVQGLCRWLIATEPEPIMVEQIVGSAKYRYAGRFDLLANIHGRRTLVDLKTNPAGRVYSEAHLQAAAYCLALEECEGFEAAADCAIIVATGEDGSFSSSVCCSEGSQFLAVLACQRALTAVRASVRSMEKVAAA